ncbi:hypothetical protein [Polaromonas sp.]|jgi:hypothetical protein|uniref:hypothetical protein n=1 Tax=Polaromonas sp. TaxID=1869339 RepID=UPI0037CB9A6F
MKNRPWAPLTEKPCKNRRELSAAIRGLLPMIDGQDRSGWESGSVMHADKYAVQQAMVYLASLSWRTTERLEWNERAASKGVFSGRAWVNGKEVDFTGDTVRDFATGAFLEFQLLAVGL